MIIKRVVRGDMFNHAGDTLVCPINVAGVMGKGMALEFANRFPGLREFYLQHYPRTDTPDPSMVNKLTVFNAHDGRKILLFPTKLHWRNPSKLEWIDTNLTLLNRHWKSWDLGHVLFPALGCGEGGLDFYNEVMPVMSSHLVPTPHISTVFEPHCREAVGLATVSTPIDGFTPDELKQWDRSLRKLLAP